LTIHCECGEDTHQTLSGWPELDIDCVCGRVWSVQLTVAPKWRPDALQRVGSEGNTRDQVMRP
jgi:hypothetical protein